MSISCYKHVRLFFCLSTCLTHLHWYVERVFCTFWSALYCHPYLFLFYAHIWLFCDCSLFLILQLLLTWCYGYWKALIIPHQSPVLPPLFVHHTGMSWTAHIFLICCLLSPVCSGFCIPTQSNSLSCIMNSASHRLDNFLAHGYSQSICNCSMFLFCFRYCSFHFFDWFG